MSGGDNYDDVVNTALAPSLNRVVRGADKLKGVRPELIEHWNKLDQEFKKAGIVPEIKSGYRTAEQQNALYRNPATRARTKGNDGYNQISPHQRGDALDVSFTANQKALGRRILAQYAQQNGLHIPSDEPWHITLSSQKPQSDPYADVVNAAIPPKETTQDDPYDDVVQVALGQPLKTPQVTSTVKELDSQQDVPTGVASQTPTTIKPLSFQPSGPTKAPTINPVKALYEASEADAVQPRGLRKLQSREYQAPLSREVGERIKLSFPHGAPTEDDVVQSYLSSLGPEYAQLGEKYKSETGHNILTLGGSVKQEDDGSFSIRPTRGAVDFINAYAKGGLDAALPLAEQQRREFIKAQEDARLRAQPAIERARRAVEIEKGSPTERGLFTAGSGPVQAAGTILGPLGSDVRRGAEEMRAVGEQAEIEKPLKSLSTGEQAAYGAGALIPTAASLLGTRGLGAAQLPALGALEGQTPQERIGGAVQGAVMHGLMGPIPEQLGESLSSTAKKTVAGPTLAAIPAGQAIAGGEPITSAVIQNAPFAVLPMLGKGASTERPTELGIEEAPTAGVPGEASANIDQRLTERELKVQPTFLRDDQGNPVARVLNPDEVAGGGKPKVRAIHQSDVQARDESGKFTQAEQSQPNQPQSQPLASAEPSSQEGAQPVQAETTPSPATPDQVRLAQSPNGPETHPTVRRFLSSDYKDKILQAIGSDAEPLNPTDLGGIKASSVSFRKPDGSIVTVSDAAFADPKAGDASYGNKRDGFVVSRSEPEGVASTPKESGEPFPNPKTSGEQDTNKWYRAWTEGKITVADLRSAAKTLDPSQVPESIEWINKTIAKAEATTPESNRLQYKTPEQRNQSIADIAGRLKKDLGEVTSEDMAELQREEEGVSVPEGKQTEASGYTQPWEMTRKEYGLDRFNEAGFDTSRKYGGLGKNWSDKVDAEHEAIVEQAVKEGKPVPPKVLADYPSLSPQPETMPAAEPPNVPREVLAPEPSTTSAKKAQVDADRAARGVEPLPWSPKSKSDVDLLESARAANVKNPDAPRVLVEEVLTKPRALSDKETVQVDIRRQELKNRHAELLKEIGDTTDPTELATKRAEFDAVEKESDAAERAWRASGTEKGRGLRSQQVTINQDFDLLSMLNRYKAKTGKEPSPEIRAEIEGYQKRIADLEKQAADREIQPTVQKMQREVRRERRQVTKKVLDDEAATIKQNIAAEFARLKAQQPNVQSTWGLGNLDPEGVITREALKYVRNRVEAGVTETAQLIDDVHGVLSEFVDGVTKRQVAEMISGYGRPTQRTRSDLQKQIDMLKVQMRQELRDADVEAGVRPSGRPQGPKLSEGTAPREGPKLSQGVGVKEGPQLGSKAGPTLREAVGKREGPELGPRQGPRLREGFRQIEGPRLSEGQGRKEGPRITDAPKIGPRETRKAIETRYNKQIEELTRRIREQDFSPKPQRGPTVLDAETRKLQVQVERAKQDYQRALRKWQDTQRSPSEKTADLIVNWARAAKLSYVSTLGKLSGAATGRMVMSPLENLIGEIPHRLAPELSRKATTEGGGFNKAAEVAALWKSGRFRQVLDQLTKGGSDLDVLFGPQGKMIDKEIQGQGILGVPGRVHGMLKEYPRQAEFDRQRMKVLRAYEREGRDITSPDVQLAANMEAFNSAERARFQQRNFISDTFNDAMRGLEKKGIAGKAASKAGRFIFPITRVPVNVVGETLNYTFGLPRAVIETAIRGGVKNLTSEQANNIMRAYKKGGVGLAVMAYAFTHPEQFGGYYQPHDKRREGEPKPGEMMFFGKRIPKWATHIPILEAAQLAATSRRVMGKLTEKGESKLGAVGGGAVAGGLGLASQIPFYETPGRIREGLTTDVGRLVGQQVKGMIPGFVQEAARVTDKNDAGETVSRKRTGFVQEIEEGIPGLRRRLPESKTERANFKDRLLENMRKGKSADLDSLVESGKITEGERKSLEREVEMTPRQSTFNKAFPDQALSRYERMDTAQRMEVQDIMEKKAYSLLNSDTLTEAQKEAFRKRIDALGIEPMPPRRSNSFVPSFRSRFAEGARP